MYQKISGIEKIYASERGRLSHFSVENFCRTVPKNVVGEHFGESGNFRYRKILCIREGGGIRFLRRKLFVTQYQKISLGNNSVIQKNSGIEKFYASERKRQRERERERERGDYHVSPSKTCCLTVPIKFVGEHFCVSKDFWYRIFEAKEGEASQFCRKFFSLTGPKKLRQGTNLFQKNSGRDKIYE